MGDTFSLINLILIGVAIFLFWRLSGVLGRRTGHERPHYDPYSGDSSNAGAANDDKVIPLPGMAKPAAQAPAEKVWEGIADEGSTVAQGLTEIALADRSFEPASFIDGARQAYEMIVTAFAQGDRTTLKPLLSRDVYGSFESVIEQRAASNQQVDTSFVGISKSDIVGAALSGRLARVTVKFVSELISCTRNAEGNVIDGDPTRVREVTDIWTFERDTSSSDPNWHLVATEAAH